MMAVASLVVLLLVSCCVMDATGLRLGSKFCSSLAADNLAYHRLQMTSSQIGETLEDIRALKAAIVDAAAGTDNGVRASDIQRATVQSLVNRLGPFNKTILRQSNVPMSGRWRLLYTTNQEFSAGKVGPFVGNVEQEIDLQNVQYTNYLSLFSSKGGIFDANLRGTFENIDDNGWKVIFQGVELKIFGLVVLRKSLAGLVGLWQTLYLDDDMRVFTANNFKDPKKTNLYVMQRIVG